MDETRRDSIANIFLIGSLALIFALICRWFLIYSEDILEIAYWGEYNYAIEDFEFYFSGNLGADLYSVLLHFIFVITGNRLIGAVIFQLLMLVGSMVLLYFGIKNYTEKLAGAAIVFISLFVCNVFPEYFSLGPDELILLFCSLSFFLISLCTFVENIFLVLGAAFITGFSIWLFPPAVFLLIPFCIGEKESERPYYLSLLSIFGGALLGFLTGLLIVTTAFQFPMEEIFTDIYWMPAEDFYLETAMFRLRTLWIVGIPALCITLLGLVLFFRGMAEKSAEEKKLKEEAMDQAIAGIEAKEEQERAGEGEAAENGAAEAAAGEAAEGSGAEAGDEEAGTAEEAAGAAGEKTGAAETAEKAEDKAASESAEEEERVFTIQDLPASGPDDEKLDFAAQLPGAGEAKAGETPEEGTKPLPAFLLKGSEKKAAVAVVTRRPGAGLQEYDFDIPEELMHYDYE